MKHTKGKWKWDKNYCSLTGDEGEEVLCVHGDDMSCIEINEANAQLITSAPELLEACKSFIVYNKDCSELSFSEKVMALAEVIKTTRQAIAKAEGKQ